MTRGVRADWGPPLALLALAVGGWEAAGAAGLGRGLPAARAQRGRPARWSTTGTLLLADAWVTAQEVLLGFALALVRRASRSRSPCTSPRCCGARFTRWWSPPRPCPWS